MRSHALFEPIVTIFCLWGRVVVMVITAKLYGNRLRGFGELYSPPNAISCRPLRFVALTTYGISSYQAAL